LTAARRPSTIRAPWGSFIPGAAVAALVIGRAIHHRRGLSAVPAIEPRIVSLLPEATDILVGIGCRDHLAAVSNFDTEPAVAGLPHVGGYQTIDWETISTLRPQWIVTHYGIGQTPAGFVERIDALGAQLLNLRTETLDGPDKTSTVYYAINELGRVCHEPQKAAQAADLLRARLAEIRQRASGKPPVPTLIVVDSEGSMVAGKETFLTELLELAGGTNVAAKFSVRYPSIDREQILAMKPEVIFQLMPGASQQAVEQSKRFWIPLADVPAVKNGRVVQLTGWYVLSPGYHVGDLAQQFFDAIDSARTPVSK
jgi:iron complex transport system substrate-binding protein